MPVGTHGFVGARLREARDARGLTQIALADLLGVSAQSISLYESGTSTPRPEVFAKITQVLSLPAAFFTDPTPSASDHGTIFWRSLATSTASARSRAERRLGWFARIVDYLKGFLALPSLDIPWHWQFDRNPLLISDEEVERAADALRVEWSLGTGPIANMAYLLENHGVMLTRWALGNAKLDAFSWVRPEDKTPFVVLGADKESSSRSRFDAGHELGHLILHNQVPRFERHTPEFDAMEAQAHRFSSAFLLPAESFSDDFVVPTLDALLALKMKWKVSVAAMLMRADSLGLMPTDLQKKLWVSYARRGFKRGEPMDSDIAVEQPEIVRRSMTTLMNNRIQSKFQVQQSLPYNESDIEELAGLPEGTLGDAPRVRLLAPQVTEQGPEKRQVGGSVVLQFPGRRSSN